MFKRLKHGGAAPCKCLVDIYIDNVTGLPATARGALVSFGRGGKWQSAKEALTVQGSANIKQAFTLDITLYRHASSKALDEKVYAFKVQPYPNGLSHPEHPAVECKLDLATYASYQNNKQTVQLSMPQRHPGAADVKLNMSLTFRMQQGIVAPDAVSEVSVQSGLTTSSVHASEQDLTGFPDPSADRRQRKQLLTASPSKPARSLASAEAAGTEDEQRSELFSARPKASPSRSKPVQEPSTEPGGTDDEQRSELFSARPKASPSRSKPAQQGPPVRAPQQPVQAAQNSRHQQPEAQATPQPAAAVNFARVMPPPTVGSKPASATSQSTAAEVEELRAQIHQLEQDVVSAALATNDEEVDALRQEVAKLQAQHNADVQALALSHDEVSEMRFVAAQLQNQVEGGSSAGVASIQESMAKQQELEQALRCCQADAADLELRLEAAERGCLQASTATHDLQTQAHAAEARSVELEDEVSRLNLDLADMRRQLASTSGLQAAVSMAEQAAQQAESDAAGQTELLKGRLHEEQSGNAALREVLASRDQTIAALTTQLAFQAEQALHKAASVKGQWADTEQQTSPRIAAVGSLRQVNGGAAADEDGLDPAVASSLQVQAAALRRTVSALQMQASATEQGLLKRLSHTEHVEQAQVATLKEEVEQKSRQVIELQSQLESAHEQLSTLQAELSAAADRSGDQEQQLLSEIRSLSQANETLSANLAAVRETLEVKVQELDDKDGRISALQRDIQASQTPATSREVKALPSFPYEEPPPCHEALRQTAQSG